MKRNLTDQEKQFIKRVANDSCNSIINIEDMMKACKLVAQTQEQNSSDLNIRQMRNKLYFINTDEKSFDFLKEDNNVQTNLNSQTSTGQNTNKESNISTGNNNANLNNSTGNTFQQKRKRI